MGDWVPVAYSIGMQEGQFRFEELFLNLLGELSNLHLPHPPPPHHHPFPPPPPPTPQKP